MRTGRLRQSPRRKQRTELGWKPQSSCKERTDDKNQDEEDSPIHCSKYFSELQSLAVVENDNDFGHVTFE